jgi:MFS superfamily sulfate permease-like transporter
MKKKFTIKESFTSDLSASIVVFLVALPLCLGIALASGAPMISGLIAGVVGGIVVGALSGSSLGVSGPAAGLAAIVIAAIEAFTQPENAETLGMGAFFVAVVLAGVIQLVLGFLRAGIIGYYFPSSVIKGMLSGIGIIIILKQIPHALGYDKDAFGDFQFFQMDGHNTISELWYTLMEFLPSATIITIVSMAILILWERPFMNRIPLFQAIKGPLVVVVVGVLATIGFQGTEWELSKEHLVNVPVFDSVESLKGNLYFANFGKLFQPEVIVLAFTIAIVASLETLLCVEATDKLDPYKRVTPTNRELKAQGVGNMISGLVGGLPITQVIVRSSANIQTGGKTKHSAIMHGFWLVIAVLLLPNILNLIPNASLAAILFLVGYKLAKPELFKEMYQRGRIDFIPFMVTILGIVFTDLLIGISLGLVIAIAQILINNYRRPYLYDKQTDDNKVFRFELSEQVSFLNKANIQKTLDMIPSGCKVILDASQSSFVHPDILEIFDDFETNAKHNDISVERVGFQKWHENMNQDEFKEFETGKPAD